MSANEYAAEDEFKEKCLPSFKERQAKEDDFQTD